MRITELRIINYKGFADSGFVPLNPAWNVIVGQNNAGKTAFIEGFRFAQAQSRPHRSEAVAADDPVPDHSRFVGKMVIGRQWLKKIWLKQGGQFQLPTSTARANGNRDGIDFTTFWDGPDLKVEVEFSPGNSPRAAWPPHSLFSAGGDQQFVTLVMDDRRQAAGHAGPSGGNGDSLPGYLQNALPTHVYVFDAKRFALGECGHADTAVLSPNADNLPAVLMKLAGNPARFREFNLNVSQIFPSIKGITAVPKAAGFEIRVWSIDPDTKRDDLAVPLNESGTGVGQVLAILYVAMTNAPGVIAIDEPNSFLHPGAAKKLIQILKRYPQHQYVISTHSPEVIGAAQPASLHLVRFDGKQSVVETFSDAEIDTKRMMLEEVGASIADIFSAERVIWVEGPTERECFELILAEELGGPYAPPPG